MALLERAGAEEHAGRARREEAESARAQVGRLEEELKRLKLAERQQERQHAQANGLFHERLSALYPRFLSLPLSLPSSLPPPLPLSLARALALAGSLAQLRRSRGRVMGTATFVHIVLRCSRAVFVLVQHVSTLYRRCLVEMVRGRVHRRGRKDGRGELRVVSRVLTRAGRGAGSARRWRAWQRRDVRWRTSTRMRPPAARAPLTGARGWGEQAEERMEFVEKERRAAQERIEALIEHNVGVQRENAELL
eukprot:3240678-Rhodomonas_salina.1